MEDDIDPIDAWVERKLAEFPPLTEWQRQVIAAALLSTPLASWGDGDDTL